MSDEEQTRRLSENDDDSIESKVGRILDAYLVEIEAGRRLESERLLVEHPTLADRLRTYLAIIQAVDSPADRLSRAADPNQTVSHNGASLWQSQGFPCSESVRVGREARRVLLRELPDEVADAAFSCSDAMPDLGIDRRNRYQLLGEIARGGMGSVIKGRDVDLGRDLAIKVQLEAHRNDPEKLHRFIDEAQIGGQLQHPGIVPIYDLGRLSDNRVFFAMKLIQGRTLSTLLSERPKPSADLPRFLGIFDQVCHAMAYAHARGVIHRDLKPSNIMVGGFGEVQVMDWGLAKVLREDDASEHKEESDESCEGAVRTLRSASEVSESRGGFPMGTFCYMSPEQARGEHDRLDGRTDVFSLARSSARF